MATSEPEHAIQAFEELAGVQVTVHDLAGHLRGRVASERLSHRHPVCTAAKHRSPQCCVAFDVDAIVRGGATADNGLVRICPFGQREVVVTTHHHGTLAWVLFAGPLLAQRTAILLEATRSLAARLREWERAHQAWPSAPVVARGGSGLPDDRRGAIERWVAVHHCQAVSLDALAAALHLSRSAASRAVRAETGYSLPQLVTKARLTTARALLRETDLAVVDVAMRSGFKDRAHFHRCFRAQVGQSPGDYRLTQRAQQA